MITHVVVKANTVFLMFICDKSELDNISDKELLQMSKDIE